MTLSDYGYTLLRTSGLGFSMSNRSHATIGLLEELTVFAAPGTFVILWASGFIGAKLGLPYAEPLTFLLLRMVGAVLLLGVFIVFARPNWPDPQWGRGQLRYGRLYARPLSGWCLYLD